MLVVKKLEKEDIPKIIDFERELRKQEPDIMCWT